MRILWVSNGRRVPTGYGNQTNIFAPALKRAGHDVTIFAYYGAEGAPSIDDDGIVTLPRLADMYGNDIVRAHVDRYNIDTVITLVNPWVLNGEQYAEMNWIAWVPVEGEPVQAADVHVLKHAKRIWAMSRHGERQLKAAGFDNVDYVPHGVDTEVFKPLDRDEARARFGKQLGIDLTGKFVIAYNAANKGSPSRKGWYECFAAFKAFSDKHDHAVLYLHTDRDGRGGVDLLRVAEMVELDPSKVIYAPQYHYLSGMLPATFLNDMYNTADVYFHPSHGEGFGIPLLEAQAAGCPVIAPNSTSMGELTMSGWVAMTRPFMHVTGQLWHVPTLDSLARALACAYEPYDDEDDTYRMAARENALAYDHRVVLERYMLPALEKSAVTRPGTFGASTLELGCGVRPTPGAVHHDRIKHAPHVDVAHDLDVLPWPWADAAWDTLLALDVPEHLHLDIQQWLDECWRILKPGGELHLRLPAWDNPTSYRDPTHQKVFQEESFYYWQPGHALHENYGKFYFAESARWWDVLSVTRGNADARYGIGDLLFTLRKRG